VVRVEVFTAVTVKNAVFWDINPEFVSYRHILSSEKASHNRKVQVSEDNLHGKDIKIGRGSQTAA
jgi:hypothetical protein